MAFEKALGRMSAPTGKTASREIADWPTDTFSTPRKNFWYGGEPIELWNVANAHSDGDVIVFFRKSDVIAAGDIIAADRYPYIDAKSGGSIQGIINGLNQIVATAVPDSAPTKFNTPAMSTARMGESTRVATTVAIALAVS